MRKRNQPCLSEFAWLMMDCNCASKIGRALIQGRGDQVFRYYWEWLEAQENNSFREAVDGERHWQRSLYESRLGSRWISEDNELVEVLDFGKWNHAEGPDFVDAIVKFGQNLPIQGDLELDHDVRDWEHHNHAQNTAYRNVLIHFFFEKPANSKNFSRNSDGRHVRQVLLDPHRMRIDNWLSACLKRPFFSGVNLADVIRLIEAAARFRILRKRASFRKQVLCFGFDEALFQNLAIGLGYRSNSLPLNLLTRRVNLEHAISACGEALLFGVAGFLRGEEFMQVSETARNYLRNLWDFWWIYRDQFSHQQLSPKLWSKSSTRPLNYPERRIGTLAVLAHRLPGLQQLMQLRTESAFVEFMESLHHPFWQSHSSFSAKSQKECLLLGKERTLDLLVNFFYPVQDLENPTIWNNFQSIRLPQAPQKIFQLASIFVGEDRLPKSRLIEAVIQQGLIQMDSHFSHFAIQSKMDKEPK
ncbi:MAG: hypothetical protein C5B47_04455 [Verrucomicrobia bacterium]|nr:MAG: hypothetical protein C5B47_04455 [Verrucomicrobiota bacterium]